MTEPFQIYSLGDTAVSVEFDNRIAPEVNAEVQNLVEALRSKPIPGILDLNPTYRALLITYDPCVLSFAKLKKRLTALSRASGKGTVHEARLFSIPVCYGGELGEDLPFVAQHAGISEEEVIRLHTEPDYLIYMLGFLPGFSYLGGLNPILNTPRLPKPRTVIPAGSVGIGGKQTGIYPLDSPGGWQLIGRTPVRPYEPGRKDPILYAAGDIIRFVPVSRHEYDLITADIAKGTYLLSVEKKGGAR